MSDADFMEIAERRRLEALDRYRIVGSGPDSRFDRICRFASEIFATRMAFVTLIEEDRQWFKSYSGFRAEDTQRSNSLCDHTIRADDVLFVPDARLDPRFSSLPIVTGAPFVRFYAGAPLVTPDGYRLGALCIADPQVRSSFSAREQSALAGLAAMVMEHMELRREGIPRTTAANFANATDLSMITVDPTGRIEFVNQAALAMFGFDRDVMIGQSIEAIVPEWFNAADDVGLALPLVGNGLNIEDRTVEVCAYRKDGFEFPVEIALSVWQDDRGLGMGAIIKDISERRDRDVRLLRLASQDTLTGLANRRWFEDRLHEELRRGEPLAVLLFDLDGFKGINDRFGHGVGDALLQAISLRLPARLDRRATLARFGGDEFAVLLLGTADPLTVQESADTILAAFDEPFDAVGHRFRVGASVGFSIAPHHGDDPQELIASADFALYRAKQAGGRVARMFEPSMRSETAARRAIRDELIRALDRKELVLHYQPQVMIDSGEVFGVEALIRWQHPERGLLAPAAFLPALEQSSVALDVGAWVLDEAARQMAAWKADGHRPVKMGINLFPAQVRAGDLPQAIADLIARYDLDPACLEIEVTETVTLNDDDRSLETIQALRDLGVGIAFDDFGTGYASLGSLQRYPLTTLKIDRAFVRDLLTRPRDVAITRALIALSRELGLKTIAEGIETFEQEQALRQMGCEAGQGYRYGKAMPAEAVADLFSPICVMPSAPHAMDRPRALTGSGS